MRENELDQALERIREVSDARLSESFERRVLATIERRRGGESWSLGAFLTAALQELEQRLLAFQSHYERSASPFNWTFTRRDLHALLAKIALKRLAPAA